MATYDIAHIREQGVEMILVPLDASFGSRSSADQMAMQKTLQQGAIEAGLNATVVPVWDRGGGSMAYLAPKKWHEFFQHMKLQDVAARINKRLTC